MAVRELKVCDVTGKSGPSVHRYRIRVERIDVGDCMPHDPEIDTLTDLHLRALKRLANFIARGLVGVKVDPPNLLAKPHADEPIGAVNVTEQAPAKPEGRFADL